MKLINIPIFRGWTYDHRPCDSRPILSSAIIDPDLIIDYEPLGPLRGTDSKYDNIVITVGRLSPVNERFILPGKRMQVPLSWAMLQEYAKNSTETPSVDPLPYAPSWEGQLAYIYPDGSAHGVPYCEISPEDHKENPKPSLWGLFRKHHKAA